MEFVPARAKLVTAIAACTFAIPSQSNAQQLKSDTSSWSHGLSRGAVLSISNLNGHVRVESGDVPEVRITAIKSWRTGDPEAVTLKVRQYGDNEENVLICANWERLTLSCDVGSYAVNNDNSNDTRLDFIVTLPRWASVSAATINGNVEVTGVERAIHGSTVNGNIVIALGPDADADVTVSSVNGTFRSDFATPLNGRGRRGTMRTRIGNGGQAVSFSTVNGRMLLARR